MWNWLHCAGSTAKIAIVFPTERANVEPKSVRYRQQRIHQIMPLKKFLKSGFTLVEIMIVVGIIGLLAAIGIRNYITARSTAQRNLCISNLKQLESAK